MALARERGAALVMSLIILLVLTIIAIAGITTSTLEERMAGNIQDATHAFEGAESGLDRALSTKGLLSPTTDTTLPEFNVGNVKVEVNTRFNQFSDPKRGMGYAIDKYDAANFDQVSTGKTLSGARSDIHRGIAQITPESN